jgi:hypothetical protein
MCEVCDKKEGNDLASKLEIFLGEGFRVAKVLQDGWEELYIYNSADEIFKLSAEGDDGGYFHFGTGDNI